MPHVRTAILLGTSVKGRYTPTNTYYRPRIEGVLSLYRSGKIDQVFITGDSANIDYNEPRWMADSLEAEGIPKAAIVLDFDGSHTKESVEHAAEFTHCGPSIVVSQKFQNERFIYMAKRIGWDVKGLNCGNYMHKGFYQIRQRVREGLSRIKAVFIGCNKETFHASTMKERPNRITSQQSRAHVNVQKTKDVTIYIPEYSKIDLVCGTMPSKADSSVIFCAEAAFTGELLDDFKHSNIAGDHVSSGKRYRGYKCKKNTGAFVYNDGKYYFAYKEYSKLIDTAAAHGGMGFGQEMIIHKGEFVTPVRKLTSKNQFRALCEYQGKLCIVDSKDIVSYSDFRDALKQLGVTEAIYLDMGYGWNFSWWRDAQGNVHDIHGDRIKYTTNWITFYNR